MGECSCENSGSPCKFSHCAWHNEAFANGFALIGFMLPMPADRVANSARVALQQGLHGLLASDFN